MNRTHRANIRKVMAAIENAPDEHFDMSNWVCGSAACIGGFAGRVLFAGGPYEHSPAEVGKALGLNRQQANALFFDVGGIEYADIGRPEALRVLDHLAKTGEVDWNKARGA